MGNKMGQDKWVNELGLFSQLTNNNPQLLSVHSANTVYWEQSPPGTLSPQTQPDPGKRPKAANKHHNVRQIQASTGHSDTKIVLNVIQT